MKSPTSLIKFAGNSSGMSFVFLVMSLSSQQDFFMDGFHDICGRFGETVDYI